MKNAISLFITLLVLSCMMPLAAAVTAPQIRAALELPESIAVTAPGNYLGSSSAWSVASDVPVTKEGMACIYSGKVTCAGGSCLVVATPAKNGYEGHLNDRGRNFFTLTVRGTGTLRFKYSTSVAYAQDAALMVYEYDGNNSTKLQVDYSKPGSDNELVVNDSFVEHFKEGEAWAEYLGEETWGNPGGMMAAEFWHEAAIVLDGDKYSHTLVFSALSPAKYDNNGDLISNADFVYDGEIVENNIYLDDFRWIPDAAEEAPQVVVFSEPDGSAFANKMLLTLSTEYKESVFRFFYTTDGSEPTTRSKEYVIYDPEGTNDDVDIDIDNNYGIQLTADTTVKVLAVERKSGEKVGVYSASYVCKQLDAPKITLIPQPGFADRTTVRFAGNYLDFDFWTIRYTLDGSEPTGNSATGVEFTLDNSQLAGKTLKVIAVVEDKFFSEVASMELVRAQCDVTWEIDGATGNQNERIFLQRVRAVLPENDDCEYTCAPASGVLSASGTVEVVAFADGKLASEKCSATFLKADTLLDCSREGIAGGADKDASGWVLYVIRGQLRNADGENLKNWLKPFELDASSGSWCQAAAIRGMTPYFVHIPSVDFENQPGDIYIVPGDSVSGAVSGKKWELVPADAEIIWNGKAYAVPAGGGEAGWKAK